MGWEITEQKNNTLSHQSLPQNAFSSCLLTSAHISVICTHSSGSFPHPPSSLLTLPSLSARFGNESLKLGGSALWLLPLRSPRCCSEVTANCCDPLCMVPCQPFTFIHICRILSHCLLHTLRGPCTAHDPSFTERRLHSSQTRGCLWGRMAPMVSVPLTALCMQCSANVLLLVNQLMCDIIPGSRSSGPWGMAQEVRGHCSLIFGSSQSQVLPSPCGLHSQRVPNLKDGVWKQHRLLLSNPTQKSLRLDRFPRCPALPINWKYLAASVIVKHNPDSILTTRDNCPVNTQDS